MDTKVLVVGAGFGGVWSAAAAHRIFAEHGHAGAVTMVAPNDALVIRPRLYEDCPEEYQVPLADVFEGTSVRRIRDRVTRIDHARRVAVLEGARDNPATIHYESLVLASGSQIRLPEIDGVEFLHHVDDLEGAIRLRDHLSTLGDDDASHAVAVVGAGFTGLEVATEMVGRLRRLAASRSSTVEPRVYLIDVADAVGPDLGPGPRPVIEEALDRLGVTIILSRTLRRLGPASAELDDGTILSVGTTIWTGGVHASPLTRQLPGRRDSRGRLEVDQYLQLAEAPSVFVAGDVAAAMAEPGQYVLPSCQHAIPLGKHAGYNAAAAILGQPLVEFAADTYVTCLDLGPAGAVLTTGWERTVDKVGNDAKAHKMRTNRDLIYPPAHDPAELLRVADFRVSTRRQRA